MLRLSLEGIVESVSMQNSQPGMDFGLIFFASSESPHSGDKYRLVLESARFADSHGFSSIWIPERHFTRDGWLYPNPAVLQAAIARETRQIRLRAGSVVLPLHNPIRVAEEWAMVDNLSGGRVSLSFASGWHPNDFALFPEHYANRNEEMYHGIQIVQKLWRGETIQVKGGDGNLVDIRTYPTPVQHELPIWITAAGNPKTFIKAGEIGANVLTHLYNHGIEELAERIQLYREARANHGYDPQTGQVAVMIHTFVWEHADAVLEQAQAVFCEYLTSASYLLNAIAYSRGQKVDLATLSEQDTREYLNFIVNRLISSHRVLFGTPETCLEVVARLQAIGITEIACQMDFGLDVELVLESLRYVNQLKNLSRSGQPLQPHPSLASHRNPTVEQRSNGSQPAQLPPSQTQETNQLQDIQKRCQQEISLTDFYSRLHTHGVQLAASFQGIERLWRHEGEALGQICLPQTLIQEAALYQIHPVLLDACFQVLIAALPFTPGGDKEALYLPTRLRSFRLHHQPGTHVWSHAILTSGSSQDASVFEGDVLLLNEEGQLLAEIRGLRLQRSEPAAQPVQHTELADHLFYQLDWEPKSLEQAAFLPHGQADKWLLFTDNSGVGQHLVDLLTARGDTCIEISSGYTYQVLQQGTRYSINPDYPEHLRRLISDIDTIDTTPLRGIIHLWSLDIPSAEELDAATLEAQQALGVGSALNVIQTIAGTQGTQRPHLWFATRGAQPVDASPLSVAQSPLWGLGRTCAIEHPELWGGLIDVDPQETVETSARQLLLALSRQHGEDQIAFRQGKSYVARLVRSNQQPRQTLTLRSDASYLITGGLWGLGFEVARWVVKKGAQYLILLGRTKLPPRTDWTTIPADSRLARQTEGLRELEASGAHVYYAPVDVADEAQLDAFMQDIRRQHYPPIRGVFHAASVWQDQQGQSLVRPLVSLDQAAVKAVFRPKVVGTWQLHKLLGGSRLDFFVLFSSGASLFGSAAQGNYAAAGAFLDAFAHYMRAIGQPALSIDWGAVSETGFGATTEGLRVHEYWESHGIQRITPQQVLAALELLIPQQIAQMGVLKLDWQQLQQFYPQLTRLALVTNLITREAESSAQDKAMGSARSHLLQRLSATGPEERQILMETYIREKVATVLRLSASKIDVQQPLTTLGLDSLMAIELKNSAELELGIHIPIIMLLQGPSISQFASQLLGLLAEAASPPAVAAASPQVAHQEQSASTAISNSEPSNAEQLLARLDQLSDDEVNSLLGSMLQQENGHIQGIKELSQQEVAQLLAEIEQLSDKEVDSLLSHIVQEEGFTQ
jgi:phthiocerol/phenolphthiocerol synthesis type-I polyketide synthase D